MSEWKTLATGRKRLVDDAGNAWSMGYLVQERVLSGPPAYDWRWSFSDGFWFNVVKGKEPNAFYRWMQTKCLGIKWERVKP